MQQQADIANVAGQAAARPPAAPVPVLELDRLSKHFGTLQALTDASLQVRAGEVLCLLGENGAGKSTLCNLIFGVYRPSAGSMRLGGSAYAPADPRAALAAGIGMVHQHFSVVPSMNVVDNLLLGRRGFMLKRQEFAEEIRARAEEFGLNVDPWRIVKDMSVGERQRLEIVKCLIARPKLLLLDEPTAVLPPEEIASFLDVCRRIADAGGALILVTHKLAEIARIADRTAILRAGRIVDTVTMQGADMTAIVQAMIGRKLQGTVAAESEMTLQEEPRPRSSVATQGMPGPAILQIDNLSYRDRNGTLRLDGITMEVRPGEIVGIAGVEGNGQTELGMILAGLERPSGGRWFAGEQEMTRATPARITAAGVGIVPEDRHAVGCITGMTIAENLCLQSLPGYSRFGLVRRESMLETARTLIERYDVRGAAPETRFSALSGGNQQKVVLARELAIGSLKVLIAAQPTRGLDVGAVEAVYSHIRSACQRGAGVLLISSELDELIAVSDRIAVIYRGRIIGELPASAANRNVIGALMSGHA